VPQVLLGNSGLAPVSDAEAEKYFINLEIQNAKVVETVW